MPHTHSAANIPPAIPNIILVVAGGRGRLPSVQVGLIIISGKSKANGARDKPRPRGKLITGRWSGAIRPCPFHSFSPRRLPVAAVPWRPVLHRSRDLLRRRGRCSRSLRRRRARACERDITVWPAQGIRCMRVVGLSILSCESVTHFAMGEWPRQVRLIVCYPLRRRILHVPPRVIVVYS
jgi:hypothetical protein